MSLGATLDISEARKQFNTLDERLSEHRIVYVTRHGKEAFALVDLDCLSAMLETLEIMSDPESYKMFQQSLGDIREGRLHDHDEVKNELG